MRPAETPIGVRAFVEGAKDSHGNPVRSWRPPVERLVFGTYPRYRNEPTVGRSETVVGLTVLAPPGFEIDYRDRVVVDGVEYEVDGEVGDWTRGPFGWAPGVEFALTRAGG